MSVAPSDAGGLDHVFPGPSELARRMRELDWLATGLGTPAQWPEHWRTAVRLCLASAFPTVLYLGPRLNIICNDAFRSIVGNAVGARLLGHPAAEQGAFWEYLGPLVRSVLETGEPRWLPDVALAFDPRLPGAEVFIRCSLGPILAADGVTVDGVFCTIVDTTALVLNARRAEELAHLDRAKDEVLATLGHELRNPLGALTNAVHLLRSLGPVDGDEERAVSVLERQVGHLSRLADDLLDMGRITSGKIRLDRRAVRLDEAVQRAVAAVNSGRLVVTHQVTLSLEPVWVDGDELRLDQVVSNLLTNAAKFTTPGGAIAVSVAATGDHATLVVQDTGAGIAQSLLPRVFDLFVQGEAEIGRARRGLGIGLALVRRLTELHEGTVTVASDGPGRGAAFTVRLPRTSAPPPAETAKAGGSGRRRRRVLVVQDDDDGREMTRRILEAEGHIVIEADSGLAGVEAVSSGRVIDIALIDVGLPDIDGYEVARRIRGFGRTDLILVAVTGYGQPEARNRAMQAGFDAHLVKPVDPAELMAVVGRPRA